MSIWRCTTGIKRARSFFFFYFFLTATFFKGVPLVSKSQITLLRSWRVFFRFPRHVHVPWFFLRLFFVPHRLSRLSEDSRLSRQKQRDLAITFLVFTGTICMRRFLSSRVWSQLCRERKLSQHPVMHSQVVFAENLQFTYYSDDDFHSFKRREYKGRGERVWKNARNGHATLPEHNEWNYKREKKRTAGERKRAARTGGWFQRQSKV